MEDSKNIKDYKLPVIDVCEDRRNFEGYKKDTYYNLGDMQQKNNKFKEQSGTTDTDTVTDPSSDKGLAAIAKKQGKHRKSWGGKKLNTDQPKVPLSIDYGR